MDYNIVEEKMKKTINFLEEQLDEIRAGRANPTILNKIEVDYYGSQVPINQAGTISVPEAKQILITPWDKTMLVPIEKALQKAGLGVNPMNDGNCIRLIFPDLNEQRRKELSKEVKKHGEDTKVAIRNLRRDTLEKAKSSQKNSEITEDELKFIEEKVQKITDSFIQKVDGVVSLKEKEIMEI